MKFKICICTFRSYGGHPSLSLVGDYFQMRAPDFGAAIQSIEVVACFTSSAALKTAYEKSEDGARYFELLGTLPTSKFLRKRQCFQITYLSQLGNAEEIHHDREPKLALFCNAAREVERELGALQRKLKASDDFDFETFAHWINSRIASLPKTEAEFIQLSNQMVAFEKQQRDALGPWEKLEIDWDDFHPESRSLLNNPFFWDCTDDCAPHGNDTGADVLADYLKWRPRNKAKSAGRFFQHLMAEWEIDQAARDNDSRLAVVFDEAVIALAFAQLKVDGFCEKAIGEQALECIKRQEQRNPKCRLNGN